MDSNYIFLRSLISFISKGEKAHMECHNCSLKISDFDINYSY